MVKILVVIFKNFVDAFTPTNYNVDSPLSATIYKSSGL
jgi:hypothetical protein